jgi:hypothetical protein
LWVIERSIGRLPWKGLIGSIREGGGRRDYREGERAAFIERFVAKAMADEGARAELIGRIAARLKELKDAAGAAGGGELAWPLRLPTT